jgi:hypothetical protein
MKRVFVWLCLILSLYCFGSAQTAPPPAIMTPANHATGIRSELTMAWSARKEARSYDLQLSNDSTFASGVINDLGLTSTTVCVTGLSHGTTYFWRVRSVNSLDGGAYSDISSFRTKAASVIEVGEIRAADAVPILRHAAGVAMLTGDALEGADITGDGTVSAYDAAIVLHLAAGLPIQYSAFTLFDNFGPAWDYNTGFGWSISGKDGHNESTYEQAMAFTASRSGLLKDIWVALSHGPMYTAREVRLMIADDLGGRPGDVLESWEIQSIGEWDHKNPPHRVSSSGNTWIEEGRQYWLWAVCDDSTFATWNMVTDYRTVCPHTLKRGGDDWLPVGYETASAFRVDIVLPMSR